MSESDDTTKTTQETCCGTMAEGPDGSFHCPMAEKFGKALGSPGLKVGLLFLGVLLVFIGILILIKPEVLAWLAGGLTILFGIMFIYLAVSLKRLATGLKH